MSGGGGLWPRAWKWATAARASSSRGGRGTYCSAGRGPRSPAVVSSKLDYVFFYFIFIIIFFIVVSSKSAHVSLLCAKSKK